MFKYFDKKQKGFTLIELLVVIAIIGILATIVIVNVNTARNKAKDTAIKGDLNSLRPAAEMIYDVSGQYTAAANGICITADFTKASGAITTQTGAATFNCYNTTGAGGAWCAKSQLVTSGTWCVDSRGNASGTSTSCTATTDCVGGTM